MNDQQPASWFTLANCGLLAIFVLGAVCVGSIFFVVSQGTPSSGSTTAESEDRTEPQGESSGIAK